jgi:hypothetical protein
MILKKKKEKLLFCNLGSCIIYVFMYVGMCVWWSACVYCLFSQWPRYSQNALKSTLAHIMTDHAKWWTDAFLRRRYCARSSERPKETISAFREEACVVQMRCSGTITELDMILHGAHGAAERWPSRISCMQFHTHNKRLCLGEFFVTTIQIYSLTVWVILHRPFGSTSAGT